jgi:hypothetical protein
MIGICNLSNIPVRFSPDSKSEIVTQLLFGETFNVIEQENKWMKITTKTDNYTGWINSKQFTPLETTIHHIESVGIYPYLKVLCETDKGEVMIPAGAVIPNLNGNSFVINKTEYKLTESNKHYNFDKLEHIALQYQNVPYLWGGRTPFGIDCSGYTQAVYKQCGIQLKRDAWQQAEEGETVSFIEEIKTGDLAFFDNEEGRITHVGIMLDPNTIIHASGYVRIDKMDNYGIINEEEKQYSHKLRIIRRIKTQNYSVH